MSKTFRAWDVDQAWLLPPSVQEFVPAGHLAHFVRDLVRETLDLSAILGVYAEERGQPPYHPGMLVALLLYGYSRGIYSSRQLARACEERVDVMAVTGLNRPDFRTISDFRKRHLPALSDLFVQVLRLCGAAGLAKLGHVAVDGTKLRANASRHKAMSYKRMVQDEPKLCAEVQAWMDAAEAADAAEDAQYGPDRRGDETPDWMASKQRRLERIRAARAQLEAEAAGTPGELDPDGPGPSSGMQQRGARKPPQPGAPPPAPPDKAQRNFTDGDSRIMPSQGGFVAGYNGQIAVDADSQVITAHRLSTNPADFDALEPLVDQTRANLGRKPREVSGDSGFASEANIAALQARRINPYLCPGRMRHGSTDPLPAGCLNASRACRPWPTSCAEPDGAAAIGCANRPSSRYSDKPSKPEASDSSCSVASTTSEPSRRWSAPATTSSNCTEPGHRGQSSTPPPTATPT